MARLMIHRNILKNFNKLPSKVQKRVSELIEEFQEDPDSDAIGMHPLTETMLDPKVRGVKKLPGGYRAIVIAPEKGDTYLLVHIDAHDKAYDWAKNKRFEVHGMTGVFQVFDTEEVRAAASQTPRFEPPKNGYPLAALSDEQLFTAGVPQPLIPAVRSVQSDAALESLAAYLPPDCRDVLYGLAAGMTLDDAIEEMLGAGTVAQTTPTGPGDFSRIQERPNFDLVLIEGQEELKQVLEASLEEWRVFLHPYQRKLVKWQTKGPMAITGAAGTGKTVVLMHRAVHLARQLRTTGQRLLVTTFTTNLSVTIKHYLQRLAPDVAERIEVTNLHALARTICARTGWKGRIAGDDELNRIWETVWTKGWKDLPLSQEDLREEYAQVIDPNGIQEEGTYLSTVRSGRDRLSRQQRKAIWPVFREFQRGLKKRDLLTFEGAIHEARLAVEQGNFPPYAQVLVDEVQDFSLEALRLIKAISPADSESPDPLCLVGDAHQRIYRSKVPMSRAGIEIRGRSRRLKINYRTSEQIRAYAHGILNGVEVDDLDGGVITTAGDHSLYRGAEPEVTACRDGKAEAEAIVAWIEWLRSEPQLGTHEICVTPYKPLIRSAIQNAGMGTLELKPHEEDPGEQEPGIRLGAMQRIKGLEFRAVALACAAPEDPMNHLESASIRARCERYVAATRAREHLLITRFKPTEP